MKEFKTILIITTAPFPFGMAGTNRILSYCKGFLYHGYQPEVFCIRPTELHDYILNYSSKGKFGNISYTYPGGITTRVASFWGRRINDLYSECATLRLLFRSLKKGKVSFVIFYGNCIMVELVSIVLSKLFKSRIYKEESENPEIYFGKSLNLLNLIKKWFVINKIYKYYRGVLVMTHPLREFFITKGIPNSSIVVVPQTVDQERFDASIDNYTISLPDEYIAYVGSINQQKDGVLTLVESFLIVLFKFPEIHLVIAGEGSSKEKDDLNLLVNQLNLNKKVHYLGRISSDKIPALLHKAKLLVSCRPKSIQSDYGFPTKIAEYLASGKPTVTTVTGELFYYLKDRVNAFIAKKADRKIFAAKIEEVLENYDFAIKVAQNGKELVKTKFNPINQTKTIIDFCKG